MNALLWILFGPAIVAGPIVLVLWLAIGFRNVVEDWRHKK